MPFGVAIFVHLRIGIGALVFTAARVSGDSAGAIFAGDATPGIFDGEVLRAAVHGVVRAAVGILDNWRGPQNLKPMPMDPGPAPELVQIGSGRR